MLKKIGTLLLLVCLVFGLVACGTKENNEKPNDSLNNDYVSGNNGTSNGGYASSHKHSYAEATCYAPKTCSCGATAGSALGHQFQPETCTAPQICSRCGEVKGKELGHNYVPATCIAPETCTRCQTTQGGALGHDYKNDVCTRCGKTDPESLPVGLEKLNVIDSDRYAYETNAVEDSFGNTYVGYHDFKINSGFSYGNAYSIFSLKNKYDTFSCDIFTLESTTTVAIYVDGVMQFQTKVDMTSGAIHVDVSVKNGQQLKIFATGGEYVYLVNAQLIK